MPAAASPCSVDETYEQVKESESDQILRNKALIIDEIESTVSSSVVSGVGWRASGIAPCLLSQPPLEHAPTPPCWDGS